MPAASNVSQPRIKGGKRGLSAAVLAILASVFAVEGGYVDNPHDPGGATNHGVTVAVARDNGFRGDMRTLTREEAAEIYVAQYIDKPGYAEIVEFDPGVGHELVDTGVNAGPGRASRWLQESLNHFNERGASYADVAEDGKIGRGTLAAYAGLQRKRGPKLACELLVKSIDAKQAQHYMRLASSRSSFETFMVGWFRTRIGNVDLVECSHAKRIAL